MNCTKQDSLLKDKAAAFFAAEYPLLQLFPYGNDILIYDAKAHFACILTQAELAVLIDFLIGKPDGDIVQAHNKANDEQALLSLLATFRDLQQAGLFLKGPAAQVAPVDRTAIQDLLQYYDENILLRKFCLQVTEDCNFRCTYCRRTINGAHAKHNLSEEHAYQGIRYYFHKYTAFFDKLPATKKELLLQIVPPTLSYYGGEPFLQFDLIEKTAAYFKSMPWQNHGIQTTALQFVSNTNLSIMNDRILRFLTDNKVTLFASLDGPEEEHDRCRVFADGRGTFKTAYANFMRIKDFDPVYFKEKVSLFGVYTANHNYAKCDAFINQQGALLCNHFPAEYAGIFVANLAEKREFCQTAFDTSLATYKAMVAKLKDQDLDAVSEAFANIFPFAKLKVDHPVGKNSLNLLLSCPMGFDNLMVAANGDYLICHKVSGQMPVGHCDTGLDMEKLITLYQQYNEAINNPACTHCWNVQFCEVCAASRMNQGHFTNPSSEECNVLRMETAYAFACFIHLSLEYPDLLEKIFNFRNDPHKFLGVVDLNEFSQ